MIALADRLPPDPLWQRIQPCCRRHPPMLAETRHAPSRTARAWPRSCSCRTWTPWALRPVGGFGCGSVTTCWRRFAEWVSAGVFERLQEVVLNERRRDGRAGLSLSRWTPAACAPFGGDLTGASPVDRAKTGSKLHVAAEASGPPLALLVTSANTYDSVVFEALLDNLPAVRTPAGGRRCRRDNCHADKADDHPHRRSYLARRGIKVRIARGGVVSSDRLGRHRWKAERSIAWLAGCRRLRIGYDRDCERCFAFAMPACARLCSNRLRAGVKGTPPGHAG
jgi:transposase